MADKLTDAEFRLIDRNDYEFTLSSLTPSQRAMVKRMRLKGFVSKRGIREGLVLITEKGKRAWWDRYVIAGDRTHWL